MEISIDKSYSSCYIKVTAENVKVEECVSESLYHLKEDGKPDYTKFKGYDIEDKPLTMFVSVLEDLIYYREREYNSTSLISCLFEKLPEKERTELLTELKRYYDEE